MNVASTMRVQTRTEPLQCPVCLRQGVVSDACPQCDADLAPLRRLQQLPDEYMATASRQLAGGSVEQAILTLSGATTLFPSARASAALADALAAAGRHSEAVSEYERAIALAPQDTELERRMQISVDALKPPEPAPAPVAASSRNHWFWVAPLLTCAAAAVLMFSQGAAHRPAADVTPASAAEAVRAALAGVPELRGTNLKVAPSGSGIGVSGELPNTALIALAREVAAARAGVPVDSSALRVRPEPAAAQGNAYTVRRGDSFWAIAVRKYGRSEMAERIRTANHDHLRPSGILYPGDTIHLPPLLLEPR